MRKLKHRLFFYLLRWWADDNYHKLSSKNGVVFLNRNRPYDLIIKKDTSLRTNHDQ